MTLRISKEFLTYLKHKEKTKINNGFCNSFVLNVSRWPTKYWRKREKQLFIILYRQTNCVPNFNLLSRIYCAFLGVYCILNRPEYSPGHIYISRQDKDIDQCDSNREPGLMGYAFVKRLHTHRDSLQIHADTCYHICSRYAHSSRGKNIFKKIERMELLSFWLKSIKNGIISKTVSFLTPQELKLIVLTNRLTNFYWIFWYISTLVIRYRIARIFQLTLPVIAAAAPCARQAKRKRETLVTKAHFV